MPPISLEQACKPRPSVFDPSVRDTVYNIDDLATIDANAFFAENYVTQGMRQLLTEAFRRLEGRSLHTSGAFLLSQSMGGGKTHNLLALGLLAKYPSLRASVMGSFHTVEGLGSVRVVTFSGRKTNTPFGIWGDIAEQLGRKDAFKDFYAPLSPPGDTDWVQLLRGEPTLILLDELPPYFSAAQAKGVGATTLDVITTTALANLLVAVSSDKLPNACVVLTDLAAAAYGAGSAAVSTALRDLERETNRAVTRIDPVRLSSDELYHIMRTRLFEQLPDEREIATVAEAYRQAVDETRRMDLTTASAEALGAEIRTSYPFHPGIRDLFARFRENPGFQQTRALIRIMRAVTAGLWQSGAARQRYLIGAHDLDLRSPAIQSEIRMINPSLDNAIAHDISSEGRTTVAETIDGGTSRDAQDAATLIFLSSLSQAVNPALGLDRSTIYSYLAAPGRDVSNLRAAIDALQARAWYLHVTPGAALYFKNTENLNAKLESYVQGMLTEERETELRARLESLFQPQLRAVYQQVEVLPALDQVSLAPDRTTLIVFRPTATALEHISAFYAQQQYKNRVFFLTGDPSRYQRVLERSAYVRAIAKIIEEFRAQRMRDDDSQMKDALEIQTREQSLFYLACREAFQQIYYPSRERLATVDLDPKYGENRYQAEDQIQRRLEEVYKYTTNTSADSDFRNRVESVLWPQALKEVPWSEIKAAAARNPGWVWHHPRALDDLRDELVRRDIWRDLDGNYVQRGPFPKPQTSVSVQRMFRDPDTGEMRLRVKPLHGDIVYVSEDGPATTSSPRLDVASDYITKAVRVSFLCVDSRGEHATGEPVTHDNDIVVKYRVFEQGGKQLCELDAYPSGTITYTVDGSSPETSGQTYTGPFELPEGMRVLQARARDDGVVSVPLSVNISRTDPRPPPVDPHKPAVWKRRLRKDATGESFELLAQVERCHGRIGGASLTVMKEQRWIELRADDETYQDVAAVRGQAELLMGIIPGGSLSLETARLAFSAGSDLEDLAAELRLPLIAAEVEQR